MLVKVSITTGASTASNVWDVAGLEICVISGAFSKPAALPKIS